MSENSNHYRKDLMNEMGVPKEDMTLLAAVKAKDVAQVKSLLDKGHNADARGNSTWTCLQEAVIRNFYDIVDVLSSKTISIDTFCYENTMGDYHTALHFAAMHRGKDVAKLLLLRGADVSLRSLNLGRTALHIAAQYGNPSIIELLLDSGADINAVDNAGKTVLDFSIMNNDLTVLKFLIDCGCDANRCDSRGETLLMSCLRNGCNNHATYLLMANIGTRIKRNFLGDTLLHFAVSCNSDEIISMIINLGVDIDAVNCWGVTAFYIACKESYYNSVESLSKYDCDITIVEKNIIRKLPNYNLVALERQAILLSALKKKTGVQNFLHIRNIFNFGFDRETHCTSCMNEVSKMKAITIGEKNITLFSVLRNDSDRIAKLLNNDKIREFSSTNINVVLPILPIYKDMISYSFTFGRIRYALIQKCCQLCIMNSSLSVLLVECIENILYRLNNVDLFSLVDSFESSNGS